MKILIQTDGASRGNPGRASYGFVIYKDKEIFYKEGKKIGITTNNVAEYTALKESLFYLEEHVEKEQVDLLVIQADSQLMIRQLAGEYKVKSPGLQPIFSQIKNLLADYPNVLFEHIRRELNKEADALCNLALDGII